MKRKDLKPGDCFRYLDPQHSCIRPCVVSMGDDLRPDHWGYSTISGLPPGYMEAEVELLEHYSTHPTPTPKKAAEVPNLLEGPIARATLDPYKMATLRQQAKSQNFGDRSMWGPSPAAAVLPQIRESEALAKRQVDLLTNMQREADKKDPNAPGIIPHKPAQPVRDAWAAALRAKVEASKAEDERKAKEREIRVDTMYEDWE